MQNDNEATPSTTPAEPPLQTPPNAEEENTDFLIVGLGASAGGLAAFEAFFADMPPDTDPGMALVLVQHLAPDHKSLLGELLQRFTAMPVFEVEDGMPARPNHVYVIPPNRDMVLQQGVFQLHEPSAPRGPRQTIDIFFRSLALDLGERAVGIVLSGTGSDGSLGLQAIKDAGGITMVQTPETAEYDGMPSSAIAAGVVDFEMSPGDMPARLVATARVFLKSLQPATLLAPKAEAETALKTIFALLRAQTGHDFSHYKPSTIHRRIERRMAVHQLHSVEDFVKYLQQTPAEVEALFRDMLIGVTHFFRDPEAFQALETQIIPKLFENKPPGSTIRVWSAGCSTGEEAYSIAILLQEHMEKLTHRYTVQVFATDIDTQAISAARAGFFPASIAADLSPQRLLRYFTAEPDGSGYRIQKHIRDMLVFSKQDLTQDPPFSKLDLMSCRNLLIYFDAALQKKLTPLFHYALKPGGILFLGTSEGVGEFDWLFTALDRKAKLFQRKEDFHGIQRIALSRVLPPMTAIEASLSHGTHKTPPPMKLPLRDLTEQALLQHLAPASALVNAHGDILYLHGRTGMYLEPAPGETSINNILKMAREGLRPGLATALDHAGRTHEIVRVPGIQVKTNGHYTLVNLIIRPVTVGSAASPEPFLYLVMLEEALPSADAELTPQVTIPASTAAEGPEADADARIALLKQALRAKDEYIQATHEELESANEELKSSIEEMQSVNEELQSTNEELETSKEELQSANVELATVNAELKAKVDDLSRANNDMNNLLVGTGIGTVFVDHQLRILRFTPSACEVINLIRSDVGRPVAHIASNLVGYDGLVADVHAVLRSLVPKEVEAQSAKGRWYKLRIQPYRTLDNVIEGAVISFFDITEIVVAGSSLHQAQELNRLALVVRDAEDAISVQNMEGQTLAWNPGAERLYGWSEAEALLLNVRDRIPQALQAEALAKLYQAGRAEAHLPYCSQRLSKTGAILGVTIISTALINAAGQVYAIATTERRRDEDAA